MKIAGHVKKYFRELNLMDYSKMLMSVNYKETSREEQILQGEQEKKLWLMFMYFVKAFNRNI